MWGATHLENAEQITSLCDDLYDDVKFNEWNIDRRILEHALIEHLPMGYVSFLDSVYWAYARQHQASARRWGDKNPSHVMDLAFVWRLFPEAKCIHIVRDGRAVFNSFRSSNLRAGEAIWPQSARRAARWWTRRLDRTRPFRANPNYMEVFYEKLVQAPEAQLRILCTFLDLDYDPVMLDFAEVNRQAGLVPPNRLAWHQSTLESVQVSRVSGWQQELDTSDIARFELLAGHHLLRYGYPLRMSTLGRYHLINQVAALGFRLVERIRFGR
jgi:hypothetical protein